ncbi:hypothetical protein ALC57_16712, partial [Trachymyrmex cornetzi]
IIHPIQKAIRTAYSLRPRRPPFLRVESDGIGVTSSIRPIFMLDRAKARRADCAPGPGVFVLLPPVALNLMCSAVMPKDLHFSATSYKTKNYSLHYINILIYRIIIIDKGHV